ncbi:toprim domain-containing protein [Prevotella sp. HUN102]|uniref:toprim domain-containing protein n=1 Tax=Prevotella sp. HUN102 TaxID=1392486 RepID=UPI00049112CA|nr:toprim domain-containing protein [Prevotella sp. HUN102]
MKEEDFSAIKRYPIVAYLEVKGFNPVRRTAAYAMYRSPIREETHPSFKVDTQKNLWIDYAEGRGGSIIDLCMRLEGCTLSEAIRRLGQKSSENVVYEHSSVTAYKRTPTTEMANGARRLIEVSDTLPPHLQEYLTRERCINLEKAMPFLCCISYEVRGKCHQAIGFANQSGGYELRDSHSFKGTIAPKDITPIFTDSTEPVCIFEGFMDFLSFLSMKEKVTNRCLVMNSASNVARAIRYLCERHLTSVHTFLDNDDAGRKAVREFVQAGINVEDMSVHYAKFKDLNEFHVTRFREQRKKQRQAEPITIKPRQVKHKIR